MDKMDKNEAMIRAAAVTMVPILERESGMFWGERSCANILRWTLEKSGFRLVPADASEHAECPVCGQPTGWLKDADGLRLNAEDDEIYEALGGSA
jgi:hypothetical protein